MCRLEAMLLLLTLALLGTPAFGVHKFYGQLEATHFCTASLNSEDVRGIRIWKQNIRLLSLQVQYGGSWTPVYGIPGGTLEEFLLNDGEVITWVYGAYSGHIRCIIVYTSWGRNYIFGRISGDEFSEFPNRPGQVLGGFCGFYRAGFGLRALGLEWYDPNAYANANGTQTC